MSTETSSRRRSRSRPTRSRPISAREILATDYPAPRWAVPGLVPEGLTILAGHPKVGEILDGLSLGVAVAAGGSFLGKRPAIKGAVTYFALEDDAPRIKDRLLQARRDLFTPESWSSSSAYRRSAAADSKRSTRGWRRARTSGSWCSTCSTESGLLDRRERTPTFTMPGRSPCSRRSPCAAPCSRCTDAPRQEGRSRRLADRVERRARDRRGCRRGSVSGAPARRSERTDADHRTRHRAGSLGLQLVGGLWHMIGPGDQMDETPERRKILAALRAADKPMGPTEVAAATGLGLTPLTGLLSRLREAGMVEKEARGRYLRIPFPSFPLHLKRGERSEQREPKEGERSEGNRERGREKNRLAKSPDIRRRSCHQVVGVPAQADRPASSRRGRASASPTPRPDVFKALRGQIDEWSEDNLVPEIIALYKGSKDNRLKLEILKLFAAYSLGMPHASASVDAARSGARPRDARR